MGARGLTAAAVLVVSGCSGPRAPVATPVPAPLVSDLPDAGQCTMDAPPAEEITFVAAGRLYAARPDGSALRCIADGVRPGGLSWSATADRVLLGGLQTVLAGGGGHPPTTEKVVSPEWSRPTGRAIVYISADRSRLLKTPAAGGAPEDISFLERHDAVAYHPAGTHIAVAGIDHEGSTGVFLATNRGADPQPLVRGEGREVLALAYAHSGVLYLAGDHGDDGIHIHELGADGVLTTLATVGPPLRALVAAQRVAGVVWTSGCVTSTPDVAMIDGIVVGSLSEPGAFVLTSCDEPADVTVWRDGHGTVLVRGADAAAVRTVLPPPPPPPGVQSDAPA